MSFGSRTLLRAVEFAAAAHAGQTDKAGMPYISHPIRVARAVLEETGNEYAAAAAVLHDVLEDTMTTPQEIVAEFGPHIASVVMALTRKDDETYADYIERISFGGRPAVDIKIADLKDNLSRMGQLDSEKAASLSERYEKALEKLISARGY